MFDLSFIPIFCHKFLHFEKNKRREKKITDLNVDCLEAVLDYLEFEDLVNVADSNIHINSVASLIFRRRYIQKEVIIVAEYTCWKRRFCCRRIAKKFEISKDSIRINDTQFVLRFLRCFGGIISEIKLDESFPFGNKSPKFNELINNHKSDQKILASINKHCTESLTKISIGWHRKGGDFKKFNTPFTKVLDVCIEAWCLFKKDDFVKIFPNIRKLKVKFRVEMNNCHPLIHNGCCAKNFPHLEYLKFSCSGFKCKICSYNAVECLRLNPQLKSLNVKMGLKKHDVPIIDIISFQRVCESLQNLQSFTLQANERFLNNFNGKTIQLKNVKLCKLSLWQLQVPFSFNQLDILIYSPYIFKFSTDPLNNIHFFEFIEKHPTITKLKVISEGKICISYRDQHKITKCLPMLEEINFNFAKVFFSTNHIIRYTTMLNSLKYLNLCLSPYGRLYSIYYYEQIKKTLNDNWLITIDRDVYVQIKRRCFENEIPYFTNENRTLD